MSYTCFNELSIVTNNKAQLQKFIEIVNTPDKDTALSFNTLVPCPIDFIEEDRKKVSSWCEDNWGTGEDIKAVLNYNDDHQAIYHFDSAWTPPIEWISRVAKMFPDLYFKLKYDNIGTFYMGVCLAHGDESIHRCLCYSYEPTHAEGGSL